MIYCLVFLILVSIILCISVICTNGRSPGDILISPLFNIYEGFERAGVGLGYSGILCPLLHLIALQLEMTCYMYRRLCGGNLSHSIAWVGLMFSIFRCTVGIKIWFRAWTWSRLCPLEWAALNSLRDTPMRKSSLKIYFFSWLQYWRSRVYI